MNSHFTYKKENTLLKVENVSLAYGDTLILRDINLEIKDIVRPGLTMGQVVSIIGKSGSGKTTLFEMLSGLLTPTTGTIKIHNPSVENNLENATHSDFLIPVRPGFVGVVQQEFPLFEFLSVYDNLYVAARKGGIPKEQRKEKIETMLNQFDLIHHKNKWTKQLSGGQRQRTSLLQQLLCSKDFILLDEPFSGQDMVSIGKLLDMLKKIVSANELLTVIIVSHDIISTSIISDTLWMLGKDKDVNGAEIPGSTIKYNYDLIERDLTWEEGIELTPKFNEFIKEIKSVFPTL